jgi:hypothetical protein
MSKGLVCVDVDGADPELARYLLPETNLVDGREGHRASHLFYVVPSEQRKLSLPNPDKSKGKLIELLGDGEQVIVPPSTHPSGSLRSWEEWGMPGSTTGAELLTRCARIAAYQVIRELWPDSGRHDLSLPLAGGLLRAGIGPEEVKWFLIYLNRDTLADVKEIESLVDSTERKLEEDDSRVTGWPTLVRELGGTTDKSIKRAFNAVLGWLDVTDVNLNDPRPRVRLDPNDTSHETAKLAWGLVGEANDPPTLFRRSNKFLRVRPYDDTEDVIVQELDYDGFKYQLEEVVCFTRVDDNGKAKPTDAPRRVLLDMRQAPNPPLPVLNRVVTVPVFTPDGTLQTEPGYHPEAKVFYEPEPSLNLPGVSLNPTDSDIKEARELLSEMLQDFHFESEADRTHAVALALLPFARDLINGPTPWHMVAASKEGTGKGLLVQVLTAIFEGGLGAAGSPLIQSEEEVRKSILTSLMESRTFIVYDNINHTVDSPSLANALTANYYTDRKLGVSESARIRVRNVWAATANNPALSNELTRRALLIRIKARDERPDLRTDYTIQNLGEWGIENRGRLVAACLTLIQAWVARGKHRTSDRMGGYTDWASTMGGILQLAGYTDFLGNIVQFRSQTAGAGVAWTAFTEGWWDEYGPATVVASDLIRQAENAGIEFKKDDAKRQVQEFGTLLSKQVGNYYGSYLIESGDRIRGKGKTYRLVSTVGEEWKKPPPFVDGR